MCFTQKKIINYLYNNRGRGVDIHELLRVIPVSRQTLSNACKQMEKYREIKVKKVKINGFIKFIFYV